MSAGDARIARVEADASDPLDAEIAAVRRGLGLWAALTLDQRARVLARTRASVAESAADWVAAACTMKGLDPDHPLRGEEWLSGPYAVLTALDTSIRVLRSLARGESPVSGLAASAAPGERTAVRTFPVTTADRLLLSGFTADVWLRPGVTRSDAVARAGRAQLTPTDAGGVGLVLGAGNITSIPVLDVFSELLSANRTAIVKLNPTMDGVRPAFERALAPLIEPGFVRIVSGDGAVGAALASHPGIDHVHVTGSQATFDAIVWGPPDERENRRRAGEPVLSTPITAELGGVSPIIVVPGRWTRADLRFHAEHIATMRLQNSGHNCIAGQVVVVSRDWPQYAEFLSALREAYARAPRRPVWYPGAAARMRSAAADPLAEDDGGRILIVHDDAAEGTEALETTEFFAPVLGVVGLRGHGRAFLDAAIAYANDRLAGTLGANVLIDPATARALGAGLDDAIADLRYGSIAINAWTGFGFLTPGATWGAYPGSTLADVGSGIGVVHNAFLLEDVERTVVRGPFRPFPRSALGVGARGTATVLPTPPWFVTSRTGAVVSEGFTRFLIDGDRAKLAMTMVQAFRA